MMESAADNPKIDSSKDPPDRDELDEKLEGKGWLRRQLILTVEACKWWKWDKRTFAAYNLSSVNTHATWIVGLPLVVPGLTAKQLLIHVLTSFGNLIVTIAKGIATAFAFVKALVLAAVLN